MKGVGLLASALFVIVACVPAASPSPAPRAPKQLFAVVELARGGAFTIALRPDQAPNTVANFVTKARDKKFDSLTFHRVEDWVVQGGDPTGTGRGGGQMQTELNALPFKAGAVGVARGPDIRVSNDVQWFVVKTDADWLDRQYTNFGQVTNGMDVVKTIRVGEVIKTVRIEER